MLDVLRTGSAEILTDAVAAVNARLPDLTRHHVARSGGVFPS